MTTTCHVCYRPSRSANLCTTCTRELRDALEAMPDDLRDLQLVATRQATGPLGLGGMDRYVERRDPTKAWQGIGSFAEGSLGDAPWDFAPGAADQLWAAGNTLTTWCRHLAESRGVAPPQPAGHWRSARRLGIARNRAYWILGREFVPSDSQPMRPLITWLLDNLETIRHDEGCEQIHEEITGLHAENLRWSLGRSGTEVFAGRCDASQVGFEQRPRFYVERNRMHVDPDGPLVAVAATCGVDLYGHEGEASVRCQACGTKYSLPDRLDDMRNRQLDDQLARAHVIADALTTLERPLGRDRLYKWIQRDAVRAPAPDGPACEHCDHWTCKLIRRPPIHAQRLDAEGQPVYRVGDVRRRLAQLASREPARLTA